MASFEGQASHTSREIYRLYIWALQSQSVLEISQISQLRQRSWLAECVYSGSLIWIVCECLWECCLGWRLFQGFAFSSSQNIEIGFVCHSWRPGCYRDHQRKVEVLQELERACEVFNSLGFVKSFLSLTQLAALPKPAWKHYQQKLISGALLVQWENWSGHYRQALSSHWGHIWQFWALWHSALRFPYTWGWVCTLLHVWL